MERGIVVQYLVAFALSLATATLGVSSAWPTPVLPKFKNNETDVNITKDQISTMLAMSAPGFVVGSFAAGFISDHFGRRTTVLAAALPMACGTTIAATATAAWLFYIMKFLWGCGTGMIASVVTIYLAEIADKDIRARLSVGTRFTFNFGSLLIISIGSFLSFRTLNYTILVLPMIFFIACLWIPESPYYYLKEGQVNDARKSLQRLKNKELVEQELQKMKEDVSKEMRNSSSVRELFTGKQYRRPIIIASGLKLAQILTGGITIQQYMGQIIQDIDMDINLSTLLIIFGIFKFGFGVMSSILADKVGRRPLLIYSFLGTGTSFVIAAIYFFLKEVILIDHLKIFGYIVFAAIIASNGISTLGFNSIIGVIQAEIFPLNVKAIAMTSLNVFGGLLGFTVAKLYQGLINIFGLCGVFCVFSFIAFFGALFSYFIVPETKGKSLREIQEILQITAYTEEENSLNDVNVVEQVEKCRELKELRRDSDLQK